MHHSPFDSLTAQSHSYLLLSEFKDRPEHDWFVVTVVRLESHRVAEHILNEICVVLLAFQSRLESHNWFSGECVCMYVCLCVLMRTSAAV